MRNVYSLVPAALRRPWRWQFSDGGDALGWTVHHTYRHAGHWLIRVSAYAPEVGRWYVFDTVAITVQGEGVR